MNNSSTEQFYTIKEVSTMCRVHPETVRNWIRSGRLAAIRMNEHKYLVRPNDLKQCLGLDPDFELPPVA